MAKLGARRVTFTAQVLFLAATRVRGASGACSASTCTELGWGKYDAQGVYFDMWPNSDPDTCGETDYPMSANSDIPLGSGCSWKTTWAVADARCTSVGARLCTVAELQADEARGTGCNYDVEQIWSSDSCIGGYSTALGASTAGTATTCTSATDADTAFVRCCADAYGCTDSPIPQPTQQPTPIPTSLPTLNPSFAPTQIPTWPPTPRPSPVPTPVPTPSPTYDPTATFSPTTWEPSATPSHLPTSIPTQLPSAAPTEGPTAVPASSPTSSPTQGTLVKCDFTHQYLCPSGCSKFSVECNEVSKYTVDAEVDVFDYDDSAF